MTAFDAGQGQDTLGIRAATGLLESGGHNTYFQVDKWDDSQISFARRKLDRIGHREAWEPDASDFFALGVSPFETFLMDHANIVLDSGWQMFMNGVAGSAVTKFANGAVGRIGGGISSAATAYSQTDLQSATGSTNRQWELINAVPTVGSTHTAGLIVAAQFPTTDGNFAWAEFGFDSGTSSGTGVSVAPMFSRGLASPGTKTSSQTWNTTITYTWL